MEANAPEKIYLCLSELAGIDYDEEWYDSPVCDSIEYTRTDAFIEKAYSFVKRKLNDYIIVDIDNKYEGIDGLFFEDFKNYMKGK